MTALTAFPFRWFHVSRHGLLARWYARRMLRRWSLWWSATLDSGRCTQDLWKARDWARWEKALINADDLNRPLPKLHGHHGLLNKAAEASYERLNLAGHTPLCLAVRLRDPAPFQALLEAGADPTLPGTPHGQRAIDLLDELGMAYRHRRWSFTLDGATPQPWHSLMQHKLALSRR